MADEEEKKFHVMSLMNSSKDIGDVSTPPLRCILQMFGSGCCRSSSSLVDSVELDKHHHLSNSSADDYDTTSSSRKR